MVELVLEVQNLVAGWSTTFQLVPSAVLHVVVQSHTRRQDESEALEGDVDRSSSDELGSLRRREHESGGETKTLTQTVEHTEGSGTLGLVSRVVGLPCDDKRDLRVS